jgi:hypothetical protein
MESMNGSTSRVVSKSRGGVGWKDNLLALGLFVVGAPLLVFLLIAGQVRLAIALTVGGGLIALATVRIQMALMGVLVYLVFLGDLRRLLIPWAGWSDMDPLLIVGPVFAIALCAYAFASQAAQADTPMARWVLALMGVMALQVFNPRQGGLLVGVAGALFYIVPLLWFWIGRSYATPAFMRTLLFKVIVALAGLAALMGLYHSFYGYLPYQQQWYDIAGYVALGAEGHKAPISFFSSSIEYANFLLVAIVVLWAVVVKEKQYVLLFPIALFFVSVFLMGSRGPIVKLLVTFAILWAVMGRGVRTWVIRGAVALCIGVAGLAWSLPQLGSVSSDARVQHRVDRQAKGLLGATEEGSSASNHLGMMLHGYKRGFKNPLGEGLGATTKAAAKFGGSGASTEVDSSDVFVSTGLVGGVIYLIIVVLIILSTVRYWRRTRGTLPLALMGALAVLFFVWLRGGQYAVSSIVWLLVGALDRFENRRASSREPTRS